MLIAIPTKGRADRQVTLRNFLDTPLMRKVVLCPPQDEHEDYGLDVRTCLVPKKYDGIARTREWIVTQLAPALKERFVLMVDDDMDFCYRPNMKSPKLETLHSYQELKKMFDLLEGWMKSGIIHVGLSARQGNNHINTPYRDATRMMNAFGYDTKVLSTLKIKYGRVPVMEDFDLTLQLLRRGYVNRVSYQYCWNQRGSNAKGGCSTYRTGKLQSEAAKELKRLHPEFVRLVRRKSKVYWEGMEERDDVQVQWRQAFESAENRKTA